MKTPSFLGCQPNVSHLKLENAIGLLFAYDSGQAITCALLECTRRRAASAVW